MAIAQSLDSGEIQYKAAHIRTYCQLDTTDGQLAFYQGNDISYVSSNKGSSVGNFVPQNADLRSQLEGQSGKVSVSSNTNAVKLVLNQANIVAPAGGLGSLRKNIAVSRGGFRRSSEGANSLTVPISEVISSAPSDLEIDVNLSASRTIFKPGSVSGSVQVTCLPTN